MNTYSAVASRDGRFWLVHIPELDKYTQARNLVEVEPMARDLIALLLDVPEDSFQLGIKVELPDSVRHHMELAAKLRDEAAHAQAEAASEYRAAANELKADGLTVRDIGKALGVSHQRVQQLVAC
jgi:DNA-directed RNA polymerase specialized sigma24 family protein